MVQCVKGLAAKLGDLNSDPKIHMVKERVDSQLPFVLCPHSGRHTKKCTKTTNKIKLYINQGYEAKSGYSIDRLK